MYIYIKYYIYIYNTIMGGGLLQIAVKGIQDQSFSRKSPNNIFKTIHKRYSNFSMESIQQHFNGTINFGRKLNCTIAKNGDLIHKIYLLLTYQK